MSEKRIVIRRKHKGGHGGSHGGAWKIAFADFMTAMMAFFLVMWLLLITPKEELSGIAEHFRMPLKEAVIGGPRSTGASSVIPGGGADPTRLDQGDVQRGEAEAEAARDQERLENLRAQLEQLIERNPELHQLRPQMMIDITPEGLRIQIVDTQNRPMFELASARVLPHMQLVLREMGPVLNDMPHKVTLAGHTDATLYANGGRSYSNWELSADRANASRRELVAGGMQEARVLRITGMGAGLPLNAGNPADPMNRRISIVVLNHATQERLERESLGTPLPGRPAPPLAPPAGPGALPALARLPVPASPSR